jgi:hypothetical protein
MANELKNLSTTVGIDTECFERLRDLAYLKHTSRRKYISTLVEVEYEKNKDSILKLRELQVPLKTSESLPNTIAKEA